MIRRSIRILKLPVWGVEILIRLDPLRHRQIVEEVLLPGWTPEPGGSGADNGAAPDFELRAGSGGDEQLLQDGKLVFEGSGRQVVHHLDRLLHIRIGARSAEAVFVHAGAVGWDGGALILPGGSRAGKSSLVHALVAAGASYLSDEIAVITPDGCVHPYPKRLKLRRAAGGSCEIPLERVNWNAAQPPLLPVGVLALEFDSGVGGGRCAIEPVSQGQAAMAILANTISARTAPSAAMETAARVCGRTRNYIGRRGEATATAEFILGELFPIC